MTARGLSSILYALMPTVFPLTNEYVGNELVCLTGLKGKDISEYWELVNILPDVLNAAGMPSHMGILDLTLMYLGGENRMSDNTLICTSATKLIEYLNSMYEAFENDLQNYEPKLIEWIDYGEYPKTPEEVYELKESLGISHLVEFDKFEQLWGSVEFASSDLSIDSVAELLNKYPQWDVSQLAQFMYFGYPGYCVPIHNRGLKKLQELALELSPKFVEEANQINSEYRHQLTKEQKIHLHLLDFFTLFIKEWGDDSFYGTLFAEWLIENASPIPHHAPSADQVSTEASELNTILYGPPGTGKTYSTSEMAVQICDGSTPSDYDEIKRRFEELKDQGRVQFLTFHQSYGYEEFVEGIRPVLSQSGAEDGDSHKLDYVIQDGIFKQMSLAAIAEHLPTPDSDSDIQQENRISRAKRAELALQNTDAGQGGIAWKANAPRYVLIIDEINRANISKVLGELITLLEPDKRLGERHEITVTLPYSQKRFGVPANLHVIGTMNTADRSIAFMDTALRRRFTFEEKIPDSGLVPSDVNGINVGVILETMNRRISILFDRDHTIGHSYLMKIESLKQFRDIFHAKLLPLLQEYFYDDWENICIVLGCPKAEHFPEGSGEINKSPIVIKDDAFEDSIIADLLNDGRSAKSNFKVNPDFLNASEDELWPFFAGILGKAE